MNAAHAAKEIVLFLRLRSVIQVPALGGEDFGTLALALAASGAEGRCLARSNHIVHGACRWRDQGEVARRRAGDSRGINGEIVGENDGFEAPGTGDRRRVKLPAPVGQEDPSIGQRPGRAPIAIVAGTGAVSRPR